MVAKLPREIQPEDVIKELSSLIKDLIFDIEERGLKTFKVPKLLEQKSPLNLRLKP